VREEQREERGNCARARARERERGTGGRAVEERKREDRRKLEVKARGPRKREQIGEREADGGRGWRNERERASKGTRNEGATKTKIRYADGIREKVGKRR
jgi:hypothetical protein